MASILVLQASPRPNGVSSHIASLLQEEVKKQLPMVRVQTFDVSMACVKGCNGCDYCQVNADCIIQDEMTELFEQLAMADAVFIVSPVYFSGAPSQFKAVLDRLQPFFWRRMALKNEHKELPYKRPAFLYIVGSGGDPHGYQALISEVTSAFALANFRVQVSQTFIGYARACGIAASDLVIPKEVFNG